MVPYLHGTQARHFVPRRRGGNFLQGEIDTHHGVFTLHDMQEIAQMTQ